MLLVYQVEVGSSWQVRTPERWRDQYLFQFKSFTLGKLASIADKDDQHQGHVKKNVTHRPILRRDTCYFSFEDQVTAAV